MKLPALTGGGVLAVAGVAAGAFVAWKLYQLAQGTGDALSGAAAVALHTATTDLNPASPENLANRAFLAIPRAITGDDSWSLGSWFYDYLHPQAFANPPTFFTPQTQQGLTASEQMGFPL